jgi:RimJ/RimL family protein N-acetyltransferase
MFPDLTSDDIFQIETKRLWLRWPKAADAAAIKSFASLADVAQMTAEIPHPYPAGEAERFVLQARADNACGRALVLVMTPKGAGRGVVGLISAHADQSRVIEIGYAVAPAYAGKGFATEALKALVDMLFRLDVAERLVANTRVVNPASRRVLEKCGFSYVDSGLDNLPARGGLHPCDRFSLDRQSWSRAGAPRAMPPMLHQLRRAVPPPHDLEIGSE